MAKMYVGKTNVIPMRNGLSAHFNELVGDPLSNEALKENFDSKVDKTSNASKIYGTDAQGTQVTYNVSELMRTQVVPEGYTEVEYISSTDNNDTAYVKEKSSDTFTVECSASAPYQLFFDQASQFAGYTIVRAKFEGVEFGDQGQYTNWKIHIYDANGTESIYYQHESTSGLHQYWLIDVSGDYQPGDYFILVQVGTEGGQYIDTGISIDNYDNLTGYYDKASSTVAYPNNVSIWVSSSYTNQYKTLIVGMRAMYGSFNRLKLVMGTAMCEVYADLEGVDTPYTQQYPSQMESQVGIYLSGQYTLGDIYYINIIDPIRTDFQILSTIKYSDSVFESAPSHTPLGAFGSMSQSGNFGVGCQLNINDGKNYLHYTVGCTSTIGLAPYRDWNSIDYGFSYFKSNDEISQITISDSSKRTVQGKSILLFGVNREDKIIYGSCSMKRTAIYINGILAFYGIPSIEKSTGEVGMYDTISATFLPSEANTKFIAGPAITSRELSLGIEEANVLLGLDNDKKLSGIEVGNYLELEETWKNDQYEELEYIEANGDCGIITDLYHDESWQGFEIKLYQTVTSAQGTTHYCQPYFGDVRIGNIGVNYQRYVVDMMYGQFRVDYSTSSTASNNVSFSAEALNTWRTITIADSDAYVDGQKLATFNPQIRYGNQTVPFNLFCVKQAYNTDNWYDNGFYGRIARVRKYNTGTTCENIINGTAPILADLIPVRRKSDGTLGFYNKFSGNFLINSKPNGQLIAGPTKKNTINLNHNYRLEDYIKQDIPGETAKSLGSIVSGTVQGSNQQGTNNTIIGNNIIHAGTNNNTIYGSSNSITASVANSTVIGKGSIAASSSSIAIGNSVKTVGEYAIVIGSGDTSTTGRNVAAETVVVGHDAQSGNNTTGAVLIGHHVVANNGNNQVAIGKLSSASGRYGVAIGYYAQAHNGGYNIAIGANARADGTGGIAIGDTSDNADVNRTIAKEYSIAIGSNAQALGSSSVAIGKQATTNDMNSSIAIGGSAEVTAPYGTCLGTGSTAGSGSIAIGYNVNGNSANTFAAGYNISHSAKDSVTIGYQASTQADDAVAIGHESSVTNSEGIAIGPTTNVTGMEALAIGNIAQAYGTYGIAIGAGSKANGNTGNIAIGHNAKVTNRSWNIAIGGSTIASADHAVALGYSAEATADYAMQLGAGRNQATGTLQFRDYVLLENDGTIPVPRLSSTSPQDGYVLTYDEEHGTANWVESQGGGGSYVLPIASASTLGGIKVGDGLQINSNTGVLSVAGGQGGGEGVWGQITGDIQDQTDLMNELNRKINQLESMPLASNTYSNQVIQFTGITDILYTHDYMYECQYHRIPSLTGYTSDDSRFTATFDPFRYRAYWNEYIHNYDLDKEEYRLEYNGSEGSWFLYNENDDLIEELSTANVQYLGVNINYYGANEPEDGDTVYIDYIPETDESEAPFGYEWVRINVQPTHEVIDNVASWSTDDALSANQGRLLQEQIDNLSTIGQFLAIWDCDTGTARYLNDGYQYTTGNYFIVGTEGTEADPTRSGTWSSEILNPGNGFVVGLDDITKWETTYGKLDHTLTFTCVVGGGLLVSYWRNSFDNSRISTSDLNNLLGINITTMVQGDTIALDSQFTVTYKKPTIHYIPTGSEYDTETGHTTTTEDVQVSDMYFYDGENWIYLANHGRQIPVDATINANSKNPVENRAVYEALSNKVSKVSVANSLYGTTAGSETGAITVGTGLDLTDGTLTADISGKQDTLVSGENIKTINGNSLLGSGDLVIQGGSGDGMGTLNISNVFNRRHDVEEEEDTKDERVENYKGNYLNILFTTNGDLDYLKANKEDIYVTYSRRNTGNSSIRKYRVLNDMRIKSDVKLYCWRWRTNKYWDSNFNTFVEDADNWDSYYSDINYEYFYTLSDYGDDVESMYYDNPAMFISDLRRQGSQKDEDNYSMGNWGTCLNEMYNFDTVRSYYDDSYEAIDEGRLQRCSKYDVDELVIDGPDMKYDEKEGEEFIIKMVCQSYMKDGQKYYFWSHEWWNEGSIYACLDANDQPIFNYVPEDKSKIVYFCEFDDLAENGYQLIEKRPDLVWWKFNEEKTDKNVTRFIAQCRKITTDASADSDCLNYYYDNPSISSLYCDEYEFIQRLNEKDGDYTLTYSSDQDMWYFSYDDQWYSYESLGDNQYSVADFVYLVNAEEGYENVEDGTVINIYFKGRRDQSHRVYFFDYPIVPKRLSQCKIVFTSLPPFQPYDEEEDIYPTDKYENYMNHAYTFDEIEANEDLSYMLSCQKEIVFVYPYDTHHLWMRTFGLSKMVYQHDRTEVQQYQWHWDGDYPVWEYDSETGERITEDYLMYAEPWDRHNILRGMFLGGQRNKGNSPLTSELSNMGDFDNVMGTLQGTGKEPRWSLGLQSLYFLPVALNINKANEVFYNTDGKATPFYIKLCITGSGSQKILTGQ